MRLLEPVAITFGVPDYGRIGYLLIYNHVFTEEEHERRVAVEDWKRKNAEERKEEEEDL